jgi:glycosyltransferase involved in cell wall biosynthesis
MIGRSIHRSWEWLRVTVHEPWLALNRELTLHTLGRHVRLQPRGPVYEPLPGSLLYVAASALPYHTSGYTTRTHEIACALRDLEPNVHVMTRPGYPWDRKDRASDAQSLKTRIGEVQYQHARCVASNRPVLQYVLQAATMVAQEAARHRVAVIHAASNHVNALPALLAARQLGIPFQYEMRGLWELTRISRQPAYEGSQAYKQGLQLEALVARHADRLFVISEQLGNYVQSDWGVDPERITLLPNCIDPIRIKPADAAQTEPSTIGYAGSLIGYEGLDTLVDAVHALVKRGAYVLVHIVGDGEARGQLEAQVRRLGLADRIRFFGKVPPEAAREIVSRCALVCIPRKPFKVCQIVPPIKLVEAMAMAKPVVVPDLPVFRDELGEESAALFFRSGDAENLAHVLKEALTKPVEMRQLGLRARTYVEQHRVWVPHVRNVLRLVSEKNGGLGC